MRPVETLVLGCMVLTAAAAQDSGESLYRANAPKFHQNFSAGNFEANGPLVTEDIDVDSNNVKFIGRENFVKRTERYSIPFPGMQLKDRVIVVDGNIAAVNYYLQGEHKGPYGKYPATGNRIEAMSGEVFEFNPQGLMKKLTTITELDRVEAEIKGTIKIAAFADITLLPNAEAQSSERAKLRATAAKSDQNVNDGHGAANAKLAVPDVRINADGKALQGRAALIEQRERLKRAFADLHIEDEYVLIDGRRAAVEYVMTGTQTGPWTMPDGSVLAPTQKKVRVRGIDFLSFDRRGLLEELVIVHNEADFATQLRP